VCGQFRHGAARGLEAVDFMPHEVRRAAGAVDHVRFPVRPRFEQHQSEGVAPRREREGIDSGEEGTLLFVRQHAESRHAILRRKAFPERAEVRHLRSGQHHPEPAPGRPHPFGGAEQIDRSFLGTVVRQVPDHDFAFGNAPSRSCRLTIAAGALIGLDTQPLKDHSIREGTELNGGGVFARRLNEHAVGLL